MNVHQMYGCYVLPYLGQTLALNLKHVSLWQARAEGLRSYRVIHLSDR